MMRDQAKARDAGDDGFDARLVELAAVLREDGVEPDRDLWPDISAALPPRAVGRPRAATGERWREWAGAALAASVLLAIGFGLAGRGPAEGPARGAATTAGTTADRAGTTAGLGAARQGLQAVDAAFDDLQAALRQSPDDPELTRLVMLIHHSRSRLLRLQADGGARGAAGGRG